MGLALVDAGYDVAAAQLQEQVNEAMKYFDVELLGGVQFKDEGPREIGFAAAQACMLTRKKKK